jgi:CubicO group peptidase (beta-lactamase class C family)
MPAKLPIEGWVAPGYEPVRRAFVRNFKEQGELGAACAVYLGDEPVVDLWGGWRSKRRDQPWHRDTLVLVLSVTKGVSALCVVLAHSRGLIDYDERVVTYWPEFGQAGKQQITVRQLLGHQAGLPGVGELKLSAAGDPDAVAAELARQEPSWRPGTRHGYHAFSLGWYESELIRRVDPLGRTAGQFFAQEIAVPLGLELYIGLPAEVPDERLARLEVVDVIDSLRRADREWWFALLAMLQPGSVVRRSPGRPAGINRLEKINTREFLSIEIPAANGVGDARSLARLYAEFARGGPALGLRRATIDELESPPRPPAESTRDAVLQVEMAYSLGLLKPCPALPFGTSHRSYGTPGAAGAFAYADPERELGYAYTPNRWGFTLVADPRGIALRDALYRCLESRPRVWSQARNVPPRRTARMPLAPSGLEKK